MNKFLRKLEEFIFENKLIQKGDKVIVGFSGGPDSLALLYSLWELAQNLNFFIIAAHVNYYLRGKDSIDDEKFVKEICSNLNIPILVKHVKIDNTKSVEVIAREIRFKFFYDILRLYKANSVALGHNANDQAETILLNLFRGAGTNGLKGILPKNDQIIHPLIEFTREEIIEYLNSKNLSWRTDITNNQNIYTRNKIRNVFIPFISDNFNPRFTQKIINTAKILRETENVLREYTNKIFPKIVIEKDSNKVVLSLNKLLKHSSILRYYFYKKIHFDLVGTDRDFFQYHYEEIEKLMKAEGSKQKSFPSNITVIKEYNTLTFQKTSSIQMVDITNLRKIDRIRARIKFENYRLYFKKLKKPDKELFKDKNIVFLDLDKIKFPLIFRHRKNGDRFIPVGHSHLKKVKEFLIDKKISRFERDKLLIVEDSEKILWIAGLMADSRAIATKETVNYLMIRLETIKHAKKRMAERLKRI